MDNPKISCLTVTEGRFDLLKKSIQCYLKQTYKNKELVIASQGTDDVNDKIESYIKELLRKDIKFFRARRELSLGAMRNLSIELAVGSVLCQWDDDDLYDPFRLATQYHLLQQPNISASIYQQHLKFFLPTREIYWVDWSIEYPENRRYLCGTAMFRKSVHDHYDNFLYPEVGPQSNKEEDWNVLDRLIEIGKIAPVIDGNQYIYVYHGNNVYDINHHKLVLDKKVMNQSELLKNKKIITDTLKSVGVENVMIRDNEGIAFKHDR